MKIYGSASLPEHLIVEDDEKRLWMVPSVASGWSKKTPFRGHKASLRPFSPKNASAIILASLGVPADVPEMSTFADKLRSLREAAGLSVADLATYAGITRQMVYALESGRADNPGLKTLRSLADALGVPIGTLAGGNG